MSLISDRPQHWNDVVGQELALRLLHALLRYPRFRPKGFIFEGPFAVGKTSTAYLYAKALMCLGDNPLGCDKCPSCKTEVKGALHPDFTEVDAATYSGVAQVRELMHNISNGPTLGKSRVVVIDEAHRLSAEAWDVFLKPLELADMSANFIFVTSEGIKIPNTIQSRCASARFNQVPLNALTGMLMATADREGIPYTQDGLKAVARHANGRPRDAIKNLGLVAACGKVTPEGADAALNHDADATARIVFEALVKNDFAAAVIAAQDLAKRIGLPKLVDVLFGFLARDVFNDKTFSPSFAPVKAMTQCFIKWSTIGPISEEVVGLMVMELNDMRRELYQAPQETGVDGVRPSLRETPPHRAFKGVGVQPKILTAEEMTKRMEG